MKQTIYLFSLLVLLTLFGMQTANAADVTISTSRTFASLDGSSDDADGSANGTFTVNGNLTISASGSIVTPGGISGINLSVSGNVILDIGAFISGDVTGSSHVGVPITVNAGGAIVLHGNGSNGAAITSNQVNGSCAGGKGGTIILVAATDFLFENGAVISANARCSAGSITIVSSYGKADIAGLVQSKSTLPGTGPTQQPGGGPISIKAKCALTVDNNATVSSEGGAPGADLVHLEACTVNIYGLVQSTSTGGFAVPNTVPSKLAGTNRPDKPANSTAGVEVWADNITINKTAPHNGEINANLAAGAGARTWVDLMARNNINIVGAGSGNYAIHANSGGNNPKGGIISIKSTIGSISASGLAVQASSSTIASDGGSVTLESKFHIDLTNASIQASGSTGGATPNGGSINVRAYGDVVGSANIISNTASDLNVTGGASPNGVVNLTACGSIGFAPGTITPAGVVPFKDENVCGGNPTLQSYVILPDASCLSFACSIVPSGCDAPDNITVDNITSSTAVVAWDSVPGANEYRLRRRAVGDTAWVYSAVLAPTTTRTFIGLSTNTTYEFQVQTYCDASRTDSSGYVSGTDFTTLPNCPIPTGLSTTNVTPNSAVANWVASGNSSGYRLRIRLAGSSDPWTVYAVNGGSITSYQFTGLTPGTSYEWRVRSNCSAFSELSAFTDPAQVFTTPVCVAPSNITVTNITSSTAFVNWDPVPGVYKYRLARRKVGDITWVTSSVLAPAHDRTFVGLAAGTAYEFNIQSYCDSTLSDSSGYVPGPGFTTLSSCPEPTNLSTTNITSIDAVAHWNISFNSSGYRVKIRKAGSTDPWNVYLINNGSITSYQFTGLTPGTSYEWRVRSNCSSTSELSAFTDPAQVFTTLVCDAPINITVTNILSSTAVITWDDIPGVYKYRLRRRPVGTLDWTYSSELAPIHTRKFVDLLAGTTYEFQIQTYCNPSLLDSSGYVSGPNFTTLTNCPAPTNLSTTGINDVSAIANWSTSLNSTDYRLKLRAAGSTDPWSIFLIHDGSVNSFQFTGLTAGTSYEWTIRANCTEFNDISNTTDPVQVFTTALARMEATEEMSAINVYPTPNNGSMTVEVNTGCNCADEATIQVTNTLGQVIYSANVAAVNGLVKKDIQLAANTANGVYILQVTQGDNSYITRFTVGK